MLENVRKFLCLWVVVCGLFVADSPKSYAAGIPVVDVDEIAATKETAFEIILREVMQYIRQGLQYETQLKNLLPLGAFIWTEANAI